MGSVIAAHYVNDQWGYSFVVPGVLLIALACLVFVALPTKNNNNINIINNNNSNQPTHLVPQLQGVLQLHQQQQQQPHHQSNSNSASMKTSVTSSSSSSSSSEAISFIRALQIPGIIHYSFALFFAKFVSYRFEESNKIPNYCH